MTQLDAPAPFRQTGPGTVAVTRSNRLHFLDALRGVAALSVVAYHYVLDVQGDGLLHGAEDAFASLIGDTLNLGKFGVALFFLISGYIIPNSLGATGDRVGRFCISRFFRLYPLYWVAVGLGILLPWPAPGPGFNLATVLANLTMVQGYLGRPDIVGTAWTLQIELAFYAVCVVLALASRMTSPRTCALACLGFLGVAMAMAVVRGVLLMKLPVALPLALSLMFFGTVWRQATLDRKPGAMRLACWLLAALAVVIAPLSYAAYNHDYGYHERWQPYVTCYVMAVVCFVACTTGARFAWRPLVWAGEVSYSIYLLHPLVAAAAYRAGLRAATLPIDPLLYVALLGAAVLVCSWASYRWIERPAVRLGHRLARRLVATPPLIRATPLG